MWCFSPILVGFQSEEFSAVIGSAHNAPPPSFLSIRHSCQSGYPAASELPLPRWIWVILATLSFLASWDPWEGPHYDTPSGVGSTTERELSSSWQGWHWLKTLPFAQYLPIFCKLDSVCKKYARCLVQFSKKTNNFLMQIWPDKQAVSFHSEWRNQYFAFREFLK